MKNPISAEQEEKMQRYKLYVPTRDIGLARGAAIVGEEREGIILAHYEEPGNYENIVTLEDRIHHAADRRQTGYPTSKMIGLNDSNARSVGTVIKLPHGWVVEHITDHEALQRWCEETVHEGGSPEYHARAAAREYNQHRGRPKLHLRCR